jgi:hypothetical protein
VKQKPTIDLLGRCRREKQQKIIAALGAAGREDVASDGLFENPLQRFITVTPKVGSNAGPGEAHVQAERVAG